MYLSRALLGLLSLGLLLSTPHLSSAAEAREPLLLEPGQLVVSLTFDDGLASHEMARVLLERHGMRGTFYVNSGRLGRDGRLTLEQLRAFQAAGHEIGGHTVSHLNLPRQSADEQARQICTDRLHLLEAGLEVSSFAYPFGALDSTTVEKVIGCGYSSGRETGLLHLPGGCEDCPVAESVPPEDAYAVRTPGSVRSHLTLEDLQLLVTRAEEAGGGWLPLVFHHLCDDCGSLSISEAVLDAFLAWLAPRAARGTWVRTVREVIGGPVQPPVPGPPPTERPLQGQLLLNPSLEEDGDGDGVPDCWMRLRYGDLSASWLRTTDAYEGSWAQRVTVTRHSSGEVKLVSSRDLGACAPPVEAGHSYRVSAWYKADARVRFAAYYRTAAGGWVWWAQGPDLPPSSSYARAEWTTPPAPPEATALSVGLSLLEPGSLTLDAHTLEDATPEPTPAISFGDTWRYEASGSDPGPDWHAVDFDDSGWASGAAQLGYGDGDEATVLPRTEPSQTSVYFRKRLTVDAPVLAATLRVLFDDGVAVWVNGVLVFGRNLDAGLEHDRYATASEENALAEVVLPPDVFLPGDNLIAVAVKQTGRTSPDLSFDLALDLSLGRSP